MWLWTHLGRVSDAGGVPLAEGDGLEGIGEAAVHEGGDLALQCKHGRKLLV